MTREDLVTLRKGLGLSQTELGERLGMSLRAIQDIENGRAELRRIHVMAAERAALDLAVEKGDPMLVPAPIRKLALDLARLITG